MSNPPETARSSVRQHRGHLTADEETTAVAELREVAGGRADLLAEVAGVLLGFHDGRRRAANARVSPPRYI